MEITYLYMDEKDIEQVAVLEKENFSQAWSANSIRHYYDAGQTLFIVAKDKDKVVGYIALVCVLDEGNIVSFAIDKCYRRMGIAAELLDICEEEAKKEEISSFYLEVRKSNEAAINFYLKSGFRQTGERKNFYDRPKEDALLLQKYI